MKKYLIALLLSLSCTFALAAVGCVSNDPPQSGSESESDSVQEITDPVAVKFVDGEGYSFTSNAQNGVVQRGSTLTFNVELGGFYTGSPLAYVNGVAIGPNADGSYSVKVDEEVTITATGVQKDISNMAGTGAFESPFQVSKPIDLLYIAEQVNKGNRTYATGAYLQRVSLPLNAGIKTLCDESTSKAVQMRMTLLEYERITPKTLIYFDGVLYAWIELQYNKDIVTAKLAKCAL